MSDEELISTLMGRDQFPNNLLYFFGVGVLFVFVCACTCVGVCICELVFYESAIEREKELVY